MLYLEPLGLAGEARDDVGASKAQAGPSSDPVHGDVLVFRASLEEECLHAPVVEPAAPAEAGKPTRVQQQRCLEPALEAVVAAAQAGLERRAQRGEARLEQ